MGCLVTPPLHWRCCSVRTDHFDAFTMPASWLSLYSSGGLNTEKSTIYTGRAIFVVLLFRSSPAKRYSTTECKRVSSGGLHRRSSPCFQHSRVTQSRLTLNPQAPSAFLSTEVLIFTAYASFAALLLRSMTSPVTNFPSRELT